MSVAYLLSIQRRQWGPRHELPTNLDLSPITGTVSSANPWSQGSVRTFDVQSRLMRMSSKTIFAQVPPKESTK